jgi:O-acetyl-ADP-ribose deacetylase (regulator of RNase III)
MMTIHYSRGDLLKAPVEALVNTVNTEGVMGKGIALQFKRAYPDMFKSYARACEAGSIQLGSMWVWQTASLEGPRLVINFPTKGHWRSRSRLADVHAGLADLRRVIDEYGIRSIAVPPLGCGNGGLDWSVVRPVIEQSLGDLAGVEVLVYEPVGAPKAEEMATATPRPRMTPGKAALVVLLQRYTERALETSLIETQKLMYFLQASGQDLKLRFNRARYGPYADNLNQVLKAIEGHFVTGFGDGSQRVSSNEPLVVHQAAVPEAEAVVGSDPQLTARLRRVLDLAEGFESSYNMELLATVHWLAQEDARVKSDPIRAGELVRAWSARKKGLFGQDDVELAWTHLRDLGWFDEADASSANALAI